MKEHPLYSETLGAAIEIDVRSTTARTLGGEGIGVRIRAEPVAGRREVFIVNGCVNESAVPADYVERIIDAFRDEVRSGGKFGYPIEGVRIVLMELFPPREMPSEIEMRRVVSRVFRDLLTKGHFEVRGRATGTQPICE